MQAARADDRGWRAGKRKPGRQNQGGQGPSSRVFRQHRPIPCHRLLAPMRLPKRADDRARLYYTPMQRDSGAPLYEFFCGGGLARLGLETDFTCVFANDIDRAKAQAYAAAFGDAHLRQGDIWTLDAAESIADDRSWVMGVGGDGPSPSSPITHHPSPIPRVDTLGVRVRLADKTLVVKQTVPDLLRRDFTAAGPGLPQARGGDRALDDQPG